MNIIYCSEFGCLAGVLFQTWMYSQKTYTNYSPSKKHTAKPWIRLNISKGDESWFMGDERRVVFYSQSSLNSHYHRRCPTGALLSLRHPDHDLSLLLSFQFFVGNSGKKYKCCLMILWVWVNWKMGAFWWWRSVGASMRLGVWFRLYLWIMVLWFLFFIIWNFFWQRSIFFVIL